MKNKNAKLILNLNPKTDFCTIYKFIKNKFTTLPTNISLKSPLFSSQSEAMLRHARQMCYCLFLIALPTPSPTVAHKKQNVLIKVFCSSCT